MCIRDSSTASFQPGPGMAIYYATKAFVLSFTEAIAEENRRKGVLSLIHILIEGCKTFPALVRGKRRVTHGRA